MITSSAAITTGGAVSHGIYAYAELGNVQVTSSAAIRTTGAGAYGIIALGNGAVTVGSTSITTTGAGSAGIIAVGFDPAAAVAVTSGTINTSGAGSIGMYVLGYGTTTVTSNAITTSGAGARGMEVVSTQAGATITSGNITTSGASSTAIEASSQTNLSITSTGSIAVTGSNSDGIVAYSSTGSILVDVNNLSATGGGADGIIVTSATGSTVTVRGLLDAAAFDVFATGAAATVNTTATGTIRGRVVLTNNADTVNNAGTFDAINNSEFNGGTDVFNNSGTVRSTNGAVSFLSLETFNNLATGRIDMRDGATGDSLTVGAYIGTTGSRLQIDANLGGNVADVLITGAATGSTILDVNLLGNSVFNLAGTLVVDATAGTSATAFTLAGGIQNNPFVALNLLFDAPNNNFLLVSNPGQPVFEQIEQAEMITNFWDNSADAISAQLEAARDGLAPLGTVQSNLTGEGGFGGWVQAVAGNTDREASNAFGNTVFNTSYQQDYVGVQGGLDYQGGGTILGVSFGYGQSDADFDATFNRVEMRGYNLAAYAAFQSGGFFFNAIAKVDWIDVESTPGAGLLAEFDATAWGLRGTMGYRFNSGDVFFEPSVSLSYVNADIDNYTVGGASVMFGDIESFRGAAGIRIGGDFRSGNGTFSPFVGAFAIEEFSGDNAASFTLGQTIGLAQDAPGTYGELQAGLNYSTGRIEVFARGEFDFGGEREGLSGRAGVRLRF